MSDTDTFRTLSFGAGTQSTALLVLSCLGKLPRLDAAIFSDTMHEPAFVYDTVEFYTQWAGEHGVPVHVVSQGDLLADLLDKDRKSASSIPAWTMGEDGREAPMMRNCTRDYKIYPIQRKMKEIMGIKPRGRVKRPVEACIGITTDEIIRMKPSRSTWYENIFPLIDAEMSRQDCLQVFDEHDLPPPKKSSCRFCPWHGDAYWADLKQSYPEEFAQSVEVDKKIRDLTHRSVREDAYIHRSLRPLDEVDFGNWRSPGQRFLFSDSFGNECEGHCGV